MQLDTGMCACHHASWECLLGLASNDYCPQSPSARKLKIIIHTYTLEITGSYSVVFYGDAILCNFAYYHMQILQQCSVVYYRRPGNEWELSLPVWPKKDGITIRRASKLQQKTLLQYWEPALAIISSCSTSSNCIINMGISNSSLGMW